MTRVKVFVNDVNTKIISTEVKREGDRGIDEARIEFPLCATVEVSDTIQIVQDAVNLDCMVAAYMMQGIVRDESGMMNNGFGEIAVPRADVVINWCATACAPVNTGFTDLCSVVNNGVTCCTGKVTSNSMCFVRACSQYISLVPECLFDFTKTAPFSISFWLKKCDTGIAAGVITKTSNLFANTGWEIGTRSSDDKLRFNFTDVCDDGIDLTWGSMAAINDGVWRNYILTYSGSQTVAGISMYENGVLLCNTLIKDNMPCAGSVSNNCEVRIGNIANCSAHICGQLDDVRIFRSKLLSAEEARSIFNRGVNLEVPGKFGSAICFNGIESNVFIPDVACLDFCGQFDIQVWIKVPVAATSDAFVFAKRSTGCDGYALRVNATCVGSVAFKAETTTLVCFGAGINDNVWHFIRAYRDSCNTIHLEIDDTCVDTAVQAACISNSADLYIGSDNPSVTTSFFDGQINVIRIYKGKNLSPVEATRIFSCVTATSLMKLGGSVTKLKNQIKNKEAIALSYGEILGTAEVRAQIYNCRTPEYIIEDLILNNTCLIPHVHGCPTGITVGRFNADGKLIDLLKDLTQMSGKTFETDPLNQFHLHDPMFNCTCFVFTHGVCAQNFDEVDDDTEIINDMVILGEVKRYDTTEIFTGCTPICTDGVRVDFPLINSPAGGSVFIGCNEQEPEVCYEFDAINKLVHFLCAPSCGTTVTVNYEYDITLIVTGQNTCSITNHGQHSKRLIMPWVRNRNDGVKFVSNYITRFKDIRTAYKVVLGVMKNSVKEGDIVTLVNDIKSINDTFVVKSITWKYPDMKTELLLGEFLFDDLEYESQISGKIHDLEAVLGEVKTIVCGETVAEALCLTDVIIVEDATASGTIYTETLTLGDSIIITVTAQGVYGDGVTEYGGDFVYATG